jgi:integrase
MGKPAVGSSEPMAPSERGANPGVEGLKTTIHQFLDSGQKSGNYRSGLKRVLYEWREYVSSNFDISTAADVSKYEMGEYAKWLAHRVDEKQNRDTDDGITAGTAWTYFDYVSAFLSWCVKWDHLVENPARKGAVLDEMPPRPKTKTDEAEFWSSDDRRQLLSYADQRVDEALDEQGFDAVEPLRDRALAYVLAYSGVRGGEILSDPRDERRDGLRWSDVTLEDGYLTVLGKNQTEEQVQLPQQAHGPLERLHTVLQPADDEWPVFPTAHSPTLSKDLPDDVERESDESWLECYRRVEETPASLSTNGARSVLERMCDDADIDVEGGYLKPHGARRGVGELVYRERGHAAAQRTLRHADPRTTSEMYAHIEASELADEVGEVFKEDDIPESYQ